MMDAKLQQQKFIRFILVHTAVMLVAVGFAIAHFYFDVGWALYPFVGVIAAAFAFQIWFIRSVRAQQKGGR